MLRTGFGGRHGNKSARTAGKIRGVDKSSNFLNLVMAIAGDQLLFCVDALSINDIATDGEVTAWDDAWGVWSTGFEEETKPPTPGIYNNKRALSFAGDNYMSSAATVAQLNGKSELTLVWFQNDVSTANFAYVLEMDTAYTNQNNFILGSNTDSTDYGIYAALRQNDGAAAYNVGSVDDAFADASLPLAPAVVFTRGAGAGNNTCVKPYINGDPVPDASIYDTGGTSNIGGTFANKKFFLASRNNGTGDFNGSIGCFIAIMRACTAGEVSRLSAAVLDRWNVGSAAARV